MRLRLRLEDSVALVFFLLTLSLQILLHGLDWGLTSPSDVLVVIPAITLLVGKELLHYFLSGSKSRSQSGEELGHFIRPYWEIIRDWLPFLIILLMYYSLWGDAAHLLVTQDRDSALIVLDQKLFGFQASVAMQRFVTPNLTAWMDFAYFYHIINIPLVACFVYLRRPRVRFREMMSGLVLVTVFGIIGYLLVPAVGPMYTLRNQYTVALTQPVAALNRQIEFMDFARIHRDVFPSLHVAISFVVWLYAFRNSRKLFGLLSPLILSLWVSTLYLRYHYLVDVVAGLALAPLSFWLANALFKRVGERGFSISLPALGRLPWASPPEPSPKVAAKLEDRP